MNTREEIKKSLQGVVKELFGVENVAFQVEHPSDVQNGDYSSNIAMVLVKEVGKSPREIAEMVKVAVEELPIEGISRIEIAGPGFINFYLSIDYYINQLNLITNEKDAFGENNSLLDEKIMVEYAHPNTHKEMHIGHMRTLIVGEALSRLFSKSSAIVFRANYQGDVGPHVAKAIWGTLKILEEKNMSLEEADGLTNSEKAHLLGEGYVRGNVDYEAYEEEIKQLNNDLYAKDFNIMPVYELTRSWSLSYYDELYERFGTIFDELFFESNIADRGVEIVKNNIGTVFVKDEGAVIFDGEKYGLHTRVFITKEGYPTYEAKDIGLAPAQYKSFSFDKNIHVVGDEQSGYFQVVFKAMSLLYPEIAEKEYHLPMGMVNLKGLKMSSRTGVIITVDGLLQEVKQELRELVGQTELEKNEQEDMLEKVTMGAVKYSVLKNDPEKYVLFDLKESINLNGNSGPYVQYAYARCRSLLAKAGELTAGEVMMNESLLSEEIDVLRLLTRFPEVVEDAAKSYKPNLVCTYIYELSQKFNTFYNAVPILTGDSKESRQFRLALTKAVSQVLKNGLDVLGIRVPERM